MASEQAPAPTLRVALCDGCIYAEVEEPEDVCPDCNLPVRWATFAEVEPVVKRAEEAEARSRELEEALRPFASVLPDVVPTHQEQRELMDHGFDPDEGVPSDLGRDAPTVADYRLAAAALENPRQEEGGE